MAFNYSNYPAYNPGYNSVQPYGNQMMTQMPQQIPPQMPIQAPQAAQQIGQGISPASRPVSNRDEANAVQADFSGAMMLFPDVTHNRIYLKRWNMNTGAAEFAEFAPVVPENVVEEHNTPAFATTEQVDELKGLLGDIKKDIEQLKKPVVTTGKAARKNDADE